MLVWLIQMSLVSLVFILLVHHLLSFLTSTLTVPKIKDFVSCSDKKYTDIYQTLSRTHSNAYTDLDFLPTIDDMSQSSHDNNNNNNELMSLDFVTSMNTLQNSHIPLSGETNTMKDELKMFLKKQFN